MGMPQDEVEALAQRLLADWESSEAREGLSEDEMDWIEYAPEQVLQLLAENRLLRERLAAAAVQP